jgi:hypothetical protein
VAALTSSAKTNPDFDTADLPVDPVRYYALSRDLRTVFKRQAQRAFRSASVISAQAASVGSRTAVRIGGPPRIAEAQIAPAQRIAFETNGMRFIVCSVVATAFGEIIAQSARRHVKSKPDCFRRDAS